MRKRYDRDLSKDALKSTYKKIQNKFSIPYKFMKFYNLTEDGWSSAFSICATTNISAPDSIHLATAKEAECDLLVTSDRFFCKNAIDFIPSCLPEKFEATLVDLGFKK